MNGAESLLRTLVEPGVEVCFASPGTSEMHFIAALDRVPGIGAVPGLFRGAVTGTADGYGRMAEKPAVTLLHLGPDLIGFRFTPGHASWLNQIEIWFSILVRKLLRRASFTSRQDLKARIEAFIACCNRTLAKPFKWTMTGKPLAA